MAAKVSRSSWTPSRRVASHLTRRHRHLAPALLLAVILHGAYATFRYGGRGASSGRESSGFAAYLAPQQSPLIAPAPPPGLSAAKHVMSRVVAPKRTTAGPTPNPWHSAGPFAGSSEPRQIDSQRPQRAGTGSCNPATLHVTARAD